LIQFPAGSRYCFKKRGLRLLFIAKILSSLDDEVEIIELGRIRFGLEIDSVAGPIGPLDLEARCAGGPGQRNRGPQALLEGRGLSARHRSILVESVTALLDRGLGGGLPISLAGLLFENLGP
jgi:hypothetical protein